MKNADPPTRRRGTFPARVLANQRLCHEHYLLTLGLDAFPPTRPGQFIQLLCKDDAPAPQHRAVAWTPDRPPRLAQSDLVRHEALLRRPFSIAGRRDVAGRVELNVLYRVIGAGTGWLERAGEGRTVSVLGPLGNAFPIRPDKPRAALIGGGVGLPPMLYLGEALAGAGKTVTAFCGVRSAGVLPLRLADGAEVSSAGEPTACAADFARHGIPAVIATDDGSLGVRGFVHEAFTRWLAPQRDAAERLVVYSCGPEAMMRAVAAACLARHVQCHLALERHMACGMGTCQSCVFKMRADNERGWVYRLVCTDGPVFEAQSIVWD